MRIGQIWVRRRVDAHCFVDGFAVTKLSDSLVIVIGFRTRLRKQRWMFSAIFKITGDVIDL